MNNNYSQDNYLLNKDTLKQYENPSPFETQDEKAQKMDQFQQYIEFSDDQVRVYFLKKVYILLTIEFFINLGMVALGLYTEMLNWFVNMNFDCWLPGPIVCDYDRFKSIQCKSNGGASCNIHPTPTWLFYISLIISLILQFTCYFGGQTARKAPLHYVTLILYIIFFGFTLTTICIFMALSLGTITVWLVWGDTFLVIAAMTFYVYVKKSEFPFKDGAILIISTAMLMVFIKLLIQFVFVLEYFYCALFSIIYGFYLMFETKFIMGKGKQQLTIDNYLIGSLLLYALIIQFLVRIYELLEKVFRRK
ncbi:unnamed protein product [Paramecium pentaurelia]|uniref:Uncharacterized protein n=1 Tax=Paramecium pentaurelia TaxID=43138 RepID=A0A8S1UT27_9CILI|nr:unnamed protein product [Paramecium pentaurelia]